MHRAWWAIGLLFLASCQPQGRAPAGSTKLAAYGSWGVETQHISRTIQPGDNFYRFVNEGWIDAATFPPGRSFFNAPWSVQGEVIEAVERLIISAANSPFAANTAQRRVGDVYAAFMDRKTINQQQLVPIREDLDEILALRSHTDVAKKMGDLRANSVFHLLVQPPVTMQGGYVLTLAQYRTTGLGLPGQEYYRSQDGDFPSYRESYVRYVAATLRRVGVDDADRRAREVLELERRYAAVMWDFARLRNAGASFNLIPTADLQRYAPGFPWSDFLRARGLEDLANINIGVGAIKESAALFKEISVQAWSAFLAFHWVNSHAQLLPDEFGLAHFDFFDRELFGVEEREGLSKRAIGHVERLLGDEVGRLYVEHTFPEDFAARVSELVEFVRQAFHIRLDAARWMDEATRSEAKSKLDAIIVEVGQPKVGVDWSGLKTSASSAVENYRRILDKRWHYDLGRIGAPISRFGDWNMFAHRIGMGYHQQYNKIFVTAGALLPPFFDPKADAAANFGAVGHTIAHEFGHALDDQGSAFDSKGVLRDWWSSQTRQAYEQRTQALIEQFGQYETLPNVALESRQMIGEIVGDSVGMSVAYLAYQLYRDANKQQLNSQIDGYTAQQRFFLAHAQQARSIATDETLRYQAQNASHPPAEFRVNGLLRNFDPWYEAFGVTQTHALYLDAEERVTIW